ncbi:hypothetical protein E2C01_013054 [Portunus trituberculatus]|uniref:Uncharacterized protein n=1 Tax=Portunus trituberculatus TaxID=210409 RepID=A0A5B7DF84_PORTR|nr:hypothetical protein [Portunus trituberculatus]
MGRQHGGTGVKLSVGLALWMVLVKVEGEERVTEVSSPLGCGDTATRKWYPARPKCNTSSSAAYLLVLQMVIHLSSPCILLLDLPYLLLLLLLLQLFRTFQVFNDFTLSTCNFQFSQHLFQYQQGHLPSSIYWEDVPKKSDLRLQSSFFKRRVEFSRLKQSCEHHTTPPSEDMKHRSESKRKFKEFLTSGGSIRGILTGAGGGGTTSCLTSSRVWYWCSSTASWLSALLSSTYTKKFRLG